MSGCSSNAFSKLLSAASFSPKASRQTPRLWCALGSNGLAREYRGDKQTAPRIRRHAEERWYRTPRRAGRFWPLETPLPSTQPEVLSCDMFFFFFSHFIQALWCSNLRGSPYRGHATTVCAFVAEKIMSKNMFKISPFAWVALCMAYRTKPIIGVQDQDTPRYRMHRAFFKFQNRRKAHTAGPARPSTAPGCKVLLPRWPRQGILLCHLRKARQEEHMLPFCLCLHACRAKQRSELVCDGARH